MMFSKILRSGYHQPAKASLLSNSMRYAATAAQAMAAETEDSVLWDKARPYEEIPGPTPLPIIGNLHLFTPKIGLMGTRNWIEQQRALVKKYGKIVKLSKLPGQRDFLFIFDPKYFEEMYRNEGPWPDRGGAQSLVYYRRVLRKSFFEGVGGGLLDSGEDWKKFRTKVNPPMMQPRIAQMYLRPIMEVSNDFIERTKSLRDSKSELPDDYDKELRRWALESIAMIALDKRLGCLEPNVKADSEPERMMKAAEDFFNTLEVLELRPPLWKVISTPTWRKFVSALDLFTEIGMKYINEAIKRMQEKKTGSDYEPSVLEKILLRDPNPKTACVMALDMLIAGVDTTSTSLSSLMYHISKNQDKQQHLFNELVKFLPNKNDNVTMDEMEQMKYLKACMKESMRLSGIAIMNMRTTVKDTVIGNYRIPKGVNVLMPHLVTGLMEENYPQPSRFVPERWLKSRPGDDANSVGCSEDFDKVSFKTHPFVFMPFGFGSRMCVGKRFAELEMMVLMMKMVRNFHIEWNYGEMEFCSKHIHKPKNPLNFKLTERPT